MSTPNPKGSNDILVLFSQRADAASLSLQGGSLGTSGAGACSGGKDSQPSSPPQAREIDRFLDIRSVEEGTAHPAAAGKNSTDPGGLLDGRAVGENPAAAAANAGTGRNAPGPGERESKGGAENQHPPTTARKRAAGGQSVAAEEERRAKKVPQVDASPMTEIQRAFGIGAAETSAALGNGNIALYSIRNLEQHAARVQMQQTQIFEQMNAVKQTQLKQQELIDGLKKENEHLRGELHKLASEAAARNSSAGEDTGRDANGLSSQVLQLRRELSDFRMEQRVQNSAQMNSVHRLLSPPRKRGKSADKKSSDPKGEPARDDRNHVDSPAASEKEKTQPAASDGDYRFLFDETIREKAVLSRRPKSLQALWLEWEVGLNGNIPAKDFSRRERGKEKVTYSRRKVFWTRVVEMMGRGMTSQEAIGVLYEAYGKDTSATRILRILRKERVANKKGDK